MQIFLCQGPTGIPASLQMVGGGSWSGIGYSLLSSYPHQPLPLFATWEPLTEFTVTNPRELAVMSALAFPWDD